MADLTIQAGDREVIDITLSGLTNAQMGTGATASFTARRRHGAPTVLTYAVGGGVVIDTSGTSPVLHVTIQAADTSWITPFKEVLLYAVVVSPNDNSGPATVASGLLTVLPAS